MAASWRCHWSRALPTSGTPPFEPPSSLPSSAPSWTRFSTPKGAHGFGRDQAALDARLAGRAIPEFLQRGMIVGTPGEVRDQVATLEAAGVQRVMLQWLDLDDVEGIADLGQALIN